jgi:hypothetical protein
MSAQLQRGTYNVVANCPGCEAVSNFSPLGTAVVVENNTFDGRPYGRVVYVFGQCAQCKRGSLASVLDNGQAFGAALLDFQPKPTAAAQLPAAVPVELVTEFREAETCAANNFNRAASALYRSVLEKALKLNGYVKGNDASLRDLQKRIDAAAADGVITEARKKRAHDEIRTLGNDVLHDEWREVSPDEVDLAHKYMQRVLEDLYDDRTTVEAILVAKGRLSPVPPPPMT